MTSYRHIFRCVRVRLSGASYFWLATQAESSSCWADAHGLQLSSEYWPLLTQFTAWEDGPGWDTSVVVESAEIVGRHDAGKRDCRKTRAYRVLRERQQACPRSLIRLNRTCNAANK
jgi:hypothetical protein